MLTIKQIFESKKQRYLIDTHQKLLDLIVNRDSKSVSQVVEGSYEYWTLVYESEEKN